MREILVSLALVGLGFMVLGDDWRGIEVAPGTWRDAVTPAQWAAFGGLLLVTGALAAPSLPTWGRRLGVLVPLALWMLWQLRHGSLWPVAFTIYAAGALVCWTAGLSLGTWLSRRRPR